MPLCKQKFVFKIIKNQLFIKIILIPKYVHISLNLFLIIFNNQQKFANCFVFNIIIYFIGMQVKRGFYFDKQINKTSQIYNSKQSFSRFNVEAALKSTQYFSQFENYLQINFGFKEIQLKCLAQYIDIGSFCRLIVQNMYLLQIAFLFKQKVYLSQEFYTQKLKISQTSQNINIFQLYCFESQFLAVSDLSSTKKNHLKFKFFKIYDHENHKMEDIFFILERLVETVEMYLQKIEKVEKISNSSSIDIQHNKLCLSEFSKTYRKFIQCKKNMFEDPKLLLKILQRTKLFKLHSILVKIVSFSLYYSIKSRYTQLLDLLKETVNKLTKSFSFSFQDIVSQEKSVEELIDNFFAHMCRAKAIQITKSLNRSAEEDNYKKGVLSLFTFQNLDVSKHPTIVASILVSEGKFFVINQSLIDMIINNCSLENAPTQNQFQPPKHIEVQVSYSLTINQIRVKAITQVEITIQNMDYLNYLISMFNEGLHSTLIIDTIDKFRKSATKRKEKVIVFKMVYNGNGKQQPLTKMLQLIDVCVLGTKIFLSELSRKSFIRLQEYEKRQRVCQIFKHYENIFRNVIKKFYLQLQNRKQ